MPDERAGKRSASQAASHWSTPAFGGSEQETGQSFLPGPRALGSGPPGQPQTRGSRWHGVQGTERRGRASVRRSADARGSCPGMGDRRRETPGAGSPSRTCLRYRVLLGASVESFGLVHWAPSPNSHGDRTEEVEERACD